MNRRVSAYRVRHVDRRRWPREGAPPESPSRQTAPPLTSPGERGPRESRWPDGHGRAIPRDYREDRPSGTALLPAKPDNTPTAAPEAAAPTVRPSPRHWLHAALTLAAVIGLLINTRAIWTGFALTRPAFTVTISACYGVMLVAAVVALCARTRAALARVDLVVLATAVVIKTLGLWPAIIGEKAIRVDEGMLMDHAARALAAGGNPYLMSWPQIDEQVATRLMDGGTVWGLGYPPFGVELGAALDRLTDGLVPVVAVSSGALLLTAVLVFAMAPVPLRPLATLGVLGTGLLTAPAENAYPSLIALPLLCVAVWGWPSIGRGGRLGRGGVLRAAALGLAVSTHQLGWFLAVFLLVGLVLVRRGELTGRATARVLLRYVAVVAGAVLLVNLPFLIDAPAAWLSGVTEPLVQHAVPHGQGIMSVSYFLVGGSGGLDFYGYASIALLLALLVAFAVHVRWLGRAAVVLPWLVFLVSIRSQDGYFVLTMPLWIVGLCTTTAEDFAGAYRLRLPRTRFRAAGVLATVGLFVPAAVCVAVAMATPQPLDMRVTSAVTPGQPVRELTVEVTNTSGRPVEPHFVVTTGVYIGPYWSIAAGPARLGARDTAVYVLVPPPNPANELVWKPSATDAALLRALSDRPETLSSVRILRGATP